MRSANLALQLRAQLPGFALNRRPLQTSKPWQVGWSARLGRDFDAAYPCVVTTPQGFQRASRSATRAKDLGVRPGSCPCTIRTRISLHDRGDDPARPKFLGRSRTVPLVLERGLLDAAQKPATEARPPQFQPVDLHDLAWAAHPAEPRGVVGPRRVDRPCHVGDPSQPFNPLMRSV